MLRVKPPTGRRLKQIRQDAAVTQAEAAEAVGVAVRTWQGWESGVDPQPKHRRRLQAWLNELERAA